jgi:transcriptional regulator with XRE-family HTH domain
MATSAARIRRARIYAKLTQNELAEKIGVRRSAVSQWEQETGTRPNAANLCQVATFTNVRHEWLATGRGPMKTDESHQASALVMAEFAHDELESRLLRAIRCMSNIRKREVIVEMIEGLVR